MKLPNGDRAFVDIRKTRDYCLNPEHPRGRHKARAFQAALGFRAEHAEVLAQALLRAAREQDATVVGDDEFGQRFMIECAVRGPRGIGQVRSFWIIRRGEDFPRLVTCYVP
jgi:hypothetical protein